MLMMLARRVLVPKSCAADTHDAGPAAFWFRRAVQLMLVMLARVLVPKSCAADAHDAGPAAFWFRRAVQLMLMMLARLRFGSEELCS